MLQQSKDAMALACDDFLKGNKGAKIKVKSNIAEDDFIPVDYLFRNYNQMPLIEQSALKLCKGNVLDVGAGVGSHALWLQENGLAVTALDISNGLCEVMRKRGVENCVASNFFDYTTTKPFDTLLMLMNGVGFVGSVDNLPLFFNKAKELLAPDGQLIFDSCDIAYLFDDPETEHLPETMKHYYGEVRYQMSYKTARTDRFNWLFIDPNMLTYLANQYGWHCNIEAGENGAYLATLNLVR